MVPVSSHSHALTHSFKAPAAPMRPLCLVARALGPWPAAAARVPAALRPSTTLMKQWLLASRYMSLQHPIRSHTTAAAPSIEASTHLAEVPQAAPLLAPAKHQTLDFTALAACCKELQTTWVPSKVEEVVQPDAYTLVLRLRTPLDQGWLHLSWHPIAARVCVGGPPFRGAVSEAFTLSTQVAAQLKGLVLTNVSLPHAWERVVQLELGARPNDPPSRRVYCEVMARYSNVIVCKADNEIVQCAYQVGGKMSSLRLVQQGRTYQLPPITSGIPPSAQEPLDSWKSNVTRAAELAVAPATSSSSSDSSMHHAGIANGNSTSDGSAHDISNGRAASGQSASTSSGTNGSSSKSSSRVRPARQPSISGGLVRAYTGTSPTLAWELCTAAGIDPAAAPIALDAAAWAALHDQWLGWQERVASGGFAASLDAATGRITFLARPGSGVPSVHALLDNYYSSLQVKELHVQLYGRVAAAVTRALKKARSKVKAFAQQLDGGAAAGALQREADVIMANVYRIEPGASELLAEDWDTGAALIIALDPTKTAVEQAEATYKRARKLRRALDAVAPLLAVAEDEIAYLEGLEADVTGLADCTGVEDLTALREVQDELVEAKYLKAPPEAGLAAAASAKGRKAQKKKERAGGGAASPFRRFTSPGGLTVLVGRNNKQNDVLSHQVANPQDIWMHVRGLPGSHVLLRIPSGSTGSVADADLQFAANLACYFSKARESTKADVIVARAEQLRKPKGAKPGQVLVGREESNVVGRAQQGGEVAAAAGGASAA